MFKKIIKVALCAVVVTSTTYAQETLTNKDGKEILPTGGEIGLGFNVVPLISYLGANTNFSQGNYVTGNNMIFGKYMLNGSSALRAHLGVNSSMTSTYNNVFDDTQNSPDSMVMDVLRNANQTYRLGAGYELRKGKGRIQGIFGADAMFSWSSNTNTYEYGNAFGFLNQAPTTTTNFFNGSAAPRGERLVSQEGGATFGVGLRPYLGVEYFFAPKISIGAEFGLNMMYNTTGESRTVTEYFDPNTGDAGTVRRNTDYNAGRNSLSFTTDNFNGAVVLMFYF